MAEYEKTKRQAVKEARVTIAELYDIDLNKTNVFEAIKDLGELDSEIIIRKFYLSEPSKKIAKKLGMTVSAVDTRTHRALKKLREILGGEFR